VSAPAGGRELGESVVLLTGATGGLGSALATRLAPLVGTLVVHGRDGERLDVLAERLRGLEGAGEVRPLVADLSRLAEVDRLADGVLAGLPELHVLVNNAGLGFGEPGSGRRTSPDGVELRWAVNYLAPYRLTRRLVPLLRASSPARIVNVASAGQYPVDRDDPQLETGYDGVRAYRQAKLALVAATIDVAAELSGSGVTANCLHPGTLMDTGMVREARIEPVDSVEHGVESTLRLIADPALDGVTGRYFSSADEARPLDQALDPAFRRWLRDYSEGQINDVFSRSS
jgi:NAD(P)-dependent dehydrogenase (short-subunit alcohol dehydrogenase family)